jgi:membrane associated rhomboid family serine protease
MHQASVGFHCPECTRQGAQRVYTARTLTRAPIVTQVLIAINVAVFIVGLGDGGTLTDAASGLTLDGALIGEGVPQLGIDGVAGGELYRLVTSGFLHSDVIHLAFNMFLLWMLGAMLEPKLGRVAFVLAYTTSLLAGSLGALIEEPRIPTVGASGAVFGLMGVALAGYRAQNIPLTQTWVGGLVVINLLLTFSRSDISIGGHLGGLAGGALCGWILLDLGPTLRERWIPSALVALVGAAAFAGSITVV